MIGSTNRKRRERPKGETARLPNGVKVVSPPKSAVSRKFLSEPDITTSGGCHVVHFKHLLGVGDQIFFIMDIFPSADPGGYRIEIIPIWPEPGMPSAPQIESICTTTSTRQEAQMHGRTTYDQAIVEARARATERFKGHLAELAARECKATLGTPEFRRPDFRFEVIEARDWKAKLQRLWRDGQIDDVWIEAVGKKTQSQLLREALLELAEPRSAKS
jgi:hypothetical protein